MKNVIGCGLIFIVALGILIADSLGAILYKTEIERNEIEAYMSDDGEHELVIYQIGEPDWSFGSTHCRFVLSSENKIISEYNFLISNDGAPARSSNFAVNWYDDRVVIIVNGEEQRDEAYNLFFDGRIE